MRKASSCSPVGGCVSQAAGVLGMTAVCCTSAQIEAAASAAAGLAAARVRKSTPATSKMATPAMADLLKFFMILLGKLNCLYPSGKRLLSGVSAKCKKHSGKQDHARHNFEVNLRNRPFSGRKNTIKLRVVPDLGIEAYSAVDRPFISPMLAR
jgi:hypothetical protein